MVAAKAGRTPPFICVFPSIWRIFRLILTENGDSFFY